MPQQRIVLPRRAGCNTPTASAAGGAYRPAGAITERQQIAQTRQVILMPQQVLVPFVQTTVSGPIRVTETQETSVVNITGTAATGAAVVGAGQVAVLPGAAAVPPAGAAAAANAAAAQNLTDCLTQLRAYEQRIAQLVAQTEALAAQVEILKGGVPLPRPK